MNCCLLCIMRQRSIPFVGFVLFMVYFVFTFFMIQYAVKINNRYNYYELAIQKWCSVEYNIHGLWPQKDSSNYPSYCSDLHYTSPTGDLLKNMSKFWNSCEFNDKFWKHEWEKHGSCVNLQMGLSQDEYFNLAIRLFESHSYLLEKCTNLNCIMGCFDLNYNVINCPTYDAF